ncbi:unnamed protein product, partial [marine sediment metagenome]
LHDAGKNKQNNVLWNCICECGQFKIVRAADLKNKHTRSCGCEMGKSLPNGQASFNQLLNGYKQGAKKYGVKFELTNDEFRELTSSVCYYCGKKPKQMHRARRQNGVYVHNGIDRVDNSKGYIIDNCVSCCSICNHMKWNLNQKIFLNHVERITKWPKK